MRVVDLVARLAQLAATDPNAEIELCVSAPNNIAITTPVGIAVVFLEGKVRLGCSAENKDFKKYKKAL